jgi:hypothetical protein
MASNGKIQIENRGRRLWMLEHPTRGRIVIGDSADRVVKGTRDPRYQPDPVVVFTRAEFDALPETDRKTVAALVKRGELQQIELAS